MWGEGQETSRGELYVRPPFRGEHKVRPYNLMPIDCELV